MKTAFLVALITAICLPQSLAAKPRKKKTPVDSVALMIDKHQWEGVNNYLFHEGTAVVEGRLVGFTETTLLSLLEPYKGSLLFVDFWNLGCGPCRASMLGQRNMVARIKQSGIPASVLYVSNDEGQRRTSAEEWLAENNIKGEHILVTNDQWMKLRSVLNFSGIPFCIIVNADGTLHGNGESTHSYEFDTLLKEKFPAYKALTE